MIVKSLQRYWEWSRYKSFYEKKILITPISRLQTSDNPAVRALSYKMATGTIHLNTYVGKTALRQKQNLDEMSNNVSIGMLEDFKAG